MFLRFLRVLPGFKYIEGRSTWMPETIPSTKSFLGPHSIRTCPSMSHDIFSACTPMSTMVACYQRLCHMSTRQIFSQQSFLYACAMQRFSGPLRPQKGWFFRYKIRCHQQPSQHNSRNPNQHLMICDVTVCQLTSVDPQLLSMANLDFLAT